MDVIALLGPGFQLASNIISGQQAKRVLDEQRRRTDAIHRLADSIYHAHHMLSVRDVSRETQATVDDPRVILDPLRTVQATLAEVIVSSSVIQSPERLLKPMQADPWQVLDQIRPAHRVSAHPNPGMIPVMFADGTQQYVGWQMKGVLEEVFGLGYAGDSGLWTPRPEEPIQSPQIPSAGIQAGKLVRLEVFRFNRWPFGGVRFRVYVNGTERGKLRNGDRQEFLVEPGRLQVDVTAGAVRSDPVVVMATPGDFVQLECEARFSFTNADALILRRK